MLLREWTFPFRWIDVKLPTAYMVLPRWTSWRICSVVPVGRQLGRAARERR
jgi:hypothetical protein